MFVFLHGDLHEDVYMIVPSDVNTSKPNQVCKLVKSFYVLKLTSRIWHEKLNGLITSHQYKLVEACHSLFIKTAH